MSIKTNLQILKEVVDIFLPTFASTFLTYIIETINLAYVGHLGDPYIISGVALGTIYFYTFGLTVLMGFNSVVATLVSQSYGQRDLRLCRHYLNRGRSMALLSCLPMSFVMLLSGPIFRFFNFDERCIGFAQIYTSMLIPMLVFQSQFDVTYKFLNCFSKTYPVVCI